MYQNDNLNQEYINLFNTRETCEHLEYDISNRLINNELILYTDDYNYLNYKLYKLYCRIHEIRHYLKNVSPTYRYIFHETHNIDSVICVF